MTGHLSASFSATLRVHVPDSPGSFARLAQAIGDAGGLLGAIDLVRVEQHEKVRDVTVQAGSAEHIEAIVAAVRERRQGTFNIAGDGVLLLSQALRRAGRPSVAVPSLLFPTVGRTMSPRGMADFSTESVRLLSYGRGLDTRAMRRTLGFEPQYDSEAAFLSFAQRHEEVIDVA